MVLLYFPIDPVRCSKIQDAPKYAKARGKLDQDLEYQVRFHNQQTVVTAIQNMAFVVSIFEYFLWLFVFETIYH
jgi:hypothetical protein